MTEWSLCCRQCYRVARIKKVGTDAQIVACPFCLSNNVTVSECDQQVPQLNLTAEDERFLTALKIRG